MHCIVSWEMTTPNLSEESKLEQILVEYQKQQILSRLYIVWFPSIIEYVSLVDKLQKTATEINNTSEIKLLISPINVAAGKYDGLLPSNMWPEINKITE